MLRFVAVIALLGCGRVNFDTQPDSGILRTDCFTDTYDTGAPSWTLYLGTWSVVDGRLAQTDVDEYRTMATVASSDWKDVDVAVDAELVSDCDTCGDLQRLVFRRADETNWAAVYYSRYYGVAGIEQWVDGARELTEQVGVYDAGRTYRLRARAIGPTVEAFLDDVLIHTWTLPAPNTRGAVGLSTDRSQAHFDSFVVTSCDAALGPPGTR